MSSFEDYKDLKINAPTPVEDAGKVLNDNFKQIADDIDDLQNNKADTSALANLITTDDLQSTQTHFEEEISALQSQVDAVSAISGYSGKSGYSGEPGCADTYFIVAIGGEAAGSYTCTRTGLTTWSNGGNVGITIDGFGSGPHWQLNLGNGEDNNVYLAARAIYPCPPTLVSAWTLQSNQTGDTLVSVLNGFTGLSGYSGSNGASGVSGYSGFATSGISGYSGRSGFSGYSGSNGASGASGYSGTSGYSGASSSGISGYSGAAGIGSAGASGVSGYSGSSSSGFSGYSGASGKSGYSGLPGCANSYTITLTGGEVAGTFTLPQTSPNVWNYTDATFAFQISISSGNWVLLAELFSAGDTDRWQCSTSTYQCPPLATGNWTLQGSSQTGSTLAAISNSYVGTSGYSGMSGRSGYSGAIGTGTSGVSGYSGAAFVSSTSSLTVISSAVTPVATSTENTVSTDAGSLTSNTLTINSPGGSPNNGDRFILRIKNTNGGSTAMTLSFNAIFNKGALTVNTVAVGKKDYFGFVYDSTASKWDLLAYLQNL